MFSSRQSSYNPLTLLQHAYVLAAQGAGNDESIVAAVDLATQISGFVPGPAGFGLTTAFATTSMLMGLFGFGQGKGTPQPPTAKAIESVVRNVFKEEMAIALSDDHHDTFLKRTAPSFLLNLDSNTKAISTNYVTKAGTDEFSGEVFNGFMALLREAKGQQCSENYFDIINAVKLYLYETVANPKLAKSAFMDTHDGSDACNKLRTYDLRYWGTGKCCHAFYNLLSPIPESDWPASEHRRDLCTAQADFKKYYDLLNNLLLLHKRVTDGLVMQGGMIARVACLNGWKSDLCSGVLHDLGYEPNARPGFEKDGAFDLFFQDWNTKCNINGLYDENMRYRDFGMSIADACSLPPFTGTNGSWLEGPGMQCSEDKVRFDANLPICRQNQCAEMIGMLGEFVNPPPAPPNMIKPPPNVKNASGFDIGRPAVTRWAPRGLGLSSAKLGSSYPPDLQEHSLLDRLQLVSECGVDTYGCCVPGVWEDFSPSEQWHPTIEAATTACLQVGSVQCAMIAETEMDGFRFRLVGKEMKVTTFDETKKQGGVCEPRIKLYRVPFSMSAPWVSGGSALTLNWPLALPAPSAVPPPSPPPVSSRV